MLAHVKIYQKASQASIFSNFTFLVVISTSALSISRILALRNYYHAPLSLLYSFQAHELPRLLNETGLLPSDNLYSQNRHQDLSAVRQLQLRLCYSKEWHRFPGHYLVPDGIQVNFVRSEFTGLLPHHFRANDSEVLNTVWWPRKGTRITPEGLNDLNREDPRQYVCCAS
jgi:alpha-1,2-mannosyltransferase